MNLWPNWVDLIVVTVIFIACYNGFHRGLLTGLLRLGGVVVVTAVTLNYAGVVVAWLTPWIRFNPTLTTFFIFWALFLILLWVALRLIRSAAKIIQWERMNWLTQGLGIFLGAIHGLWWAGLVVLALAMSGFFYLQESVEEQSVLGPRLVELARGVFEDVSNRFPGADQRLPTLMPSCR